MESIKVYKVVCVGSSKGLLVKYRDVRIFFWGQESQGISKVRESSWQSQWKIRDRIIYSGWNKDSEEYKKTFLLGKTIPYFTKFVSSKLCKNVHVVKNLNVIIFYDFMLASKRSWRKCEIHNWTFLTKRGQDFFWSFRWVTTLWRPGGKSDIHL